MLLFLTINNIFVQILYAMSEKELIILLKNGDEKAFTTLYRLYWSKVYNFSRLYLSSITEVEEVVQEVFVKVWETRDFLRDIFLLLHAILFLISFVKVSMRMPINLRC